MMSRVTLSAFAALALAGTAGGLYLGNAAVAEINPIYYDRPEARFHADLVPHRSIEPAGYRAGELSAANVEQAFGSSCVGCRIYPEEVLVHRGTSGKAEFGIAEVVAEPVQAVVYEEAPAPEFASVERYTSYPVAQVEPAAASRAEPAPVVPSAVEPTE